MLKKFKKVVIIAGAGPAGLTAAYELQEKTGFDIVLVEESNQVGGISKTIDYKGNKIDIGGHRFFSKSSNILNWWNKFLPIISELEELTLTYQQQNTNLKIDRKKEDCEPHFMVRPRKSRILYKKHFFDYPVKANFSTFYKFGFFKMLKIGHSLMWSSIFPINPEKNLEDFYINRFGKELYLTFFKTYTHKVWGIPCNEISADWGKQRVKNLGIKKLFRHYLSNTFLPHRRKFGNKNVEQSLTEFFLYPQKGPGQLWEKVASVLLPERVKLIKNTKVNLINIENSQVNSVEIINKIDGKIDTIKCDYFISSMPIKHLIQGMNDIPNEVTTIISNLKYRDFIIVGLLLKDLKMKNDDGSHIKDNWLYIQNDNVLVGRVQLFHNWSDEMVKDSNNCWIGAEFFCNETDEFWKKDDKSIIKQAIEELTQINLINPNDYLDGVVIRVPKAYPSYTGTYNNFSVVIDYLNRIKNIFPIGRNGMHKYNNQDHSMLSAMTAVENIINRNEDKSNIWAINTEDEYLEAK